MDNKNGLHGTISKNSSNIYGSVDKNSPAFNNLKKQVEQNTENIATNATAIDELKTKVKELAVKVSQITQEIIPIIEEKLAEFKVYVDTKVAELVVKITEAKQESKDYTDTQVASAKTELKQYTDSEIAKLDVKFEELRQYVQEYVKEKLEEVDAKIATLRSEFDVFKGEVDTKVATLQSNIDALAAEIDVKIAETKTYVDEKVSNISLRIDALEVEIASKVDKETYEADKEALDKKLAVKGEAFYYDTLGELDPVEHKPYWYMSSDINNCTVDTLLKDQSGNYVPYDFGSGGGGSTIDVYITQKSWPTVIASGHECNITVNWYAMRDEKQMAGTGTLILKVNGETVATKYNVSQGDITFENIEDYLTSDENTVLVYASFRTAYNETTNTIKVVSLVLKSDFDSDIIRSGSFNYICQPVTSGTKTFYYYVDGELAGTEIITTTEQVTKQFSNWSHGAHKLEVYFTCHIGDEDIESNHLVYDIIYTVGGDENPIIASSFNDLEQEQYVQFAIPYRVYTPGANTSHIILLINDDIQSELDVPQSIQNWTYSAKEVGSYKFTIKCEDIKKEFDITIKASEVPVTPVTSDLALSLTTVGRSNRESAEERIKWEDKDRQISCILTDFNFTTTDGWLQDSDNNTILRVTGDARVEIPYKVFDAGKEIKDTGKTIEIEIATSNVMDYEATIMSCWSDDRGFYITPQLGVIKSQLTSLQTQYKEDEHIRLSFVIEKKNGTRLILMYINGIMSGATQYSTSDDFSQNNPVNISIGSNEATIDIYNIRIYDNNLSKEQIVNNWIADTQLGELKKQRYLRNNNFNSYGKIDIAHLPSDLSYIIWDIDNLPESKTAIPGNAEYVENSDTSRNFTATNAQYKVQGTSSAGYPVKNIRIKYKKNSDWPDKPFIWVDKDGNKISSFAIEKDEIPANYFTYKVDFASSEGANNVELVKLYNDISKDYGIKTPPQQSNPKVRVGIDGFPIVAFKKDSDNTINFYTKANFNNDKDNTEVYGFDTNDESWEITNNTADVTKFKVGNITNIDHYDEEGNPVYIWETGFEIRYPDADDWSGDLSKLDNMVTWVASTYRNKATESTFETPVTFTYEETIAQGDGTYKKQTTTKTFTSDTKEYRLTKFKAELSNWFDVDSTLFYYLFTQQYLMIDSRAKNAFPTYFASREEDDGGDKWFWLPYDMDTAIGIDNKGKLVFDYNLEDTDTVEGAAVYNGQDSVMWNNLRDAFSGELSEMYSKLRASGESSLLSYTTTENRFEAHQEKWSENIFNEDSKLKYIDTLSTGDNYLDMLQGGKVEQRKWWLYNRFKYLDSKYNAGGVEADRITIRAYIPAGEEKPDITVIPYADIYATVSYMNGPVNTVSKRAKRGEATTLKNPVGKEAEFTDQETYIYSASQLKSVGDLSPFYPDTVKVGSAIRLQELLVGSNREGYENTHLNVLELGNNTLLKTLDVRNCINLSQSVNIENCINIEKVYFDNTKITELKLPEGGILSILHLPDTITSLELKDKKSLTEFNYTPSSTLQRLWLENIDFNLVDAKTYINNMSSSGRIRLIGFNINASGYEEIKALYDRLDGMSGINAQGGNVPTAQVEGTINVNEILYADYIALIARYPNIEINASIIKCKVTFYNEGSIYYIGTEPQIQLITQGKKATKPIVDPTKASTKEYYYIFEGWDRDLDLVVETDLDINATYSTHDRYYDVTFDYQYSEIPSYTDSIKAGNKVNKPEDPTREGAQFLGWYTNAEGTGSKYDFDTQIYNSFTLYAKWEDADLPTVEFVWENHKKIHAVLKDKIGITAWNYTLEDVAPTTWITLEKKTEQNVYVDVTQAGTYYVWAKDTNQEHKPTKNSISAYNVTKVQAQYKEQVAAPITLKEIIGEAEQLEIADLALNGTKIKYSAELDDHFNTLKNYCNDVEIQLGDIRTVNSDLTYKTTCDPKVYTVKFDIGEYGEAVEDQHIIYKHLATAPEWQYVEGKLARYWYTEPEFITKWDFDNDRVVDNTQLYAKWEDYQEPSKITVNIDSVPKTLRANWYQEKANGVEVYWGEGSIITSDVVGDTYLEHTYETVGTYEITLRCIEGLHHLGAGNTKQIIVPADTITNVEFAFNMDSVAAYALSDAVNLTEITIPRYMSTLATGLFRNCSNLATVVLPDTLKVVQNQVFSNCTSLVDEFTLPNNVNKLGTYVFSGCTGLTKINLGNNITILDAGVFSACTKLTEFSIPSSVTTIKLRAFSNCYKLAKLIIPKAVTDIAAYAFSSCNLLKTVGPAGGDYNIEIAWEDKIPDYAFEQSSITSVELPSTITEIGIDAFAYTNLNNINLPTGLLKIGAQAFSECTSLTSIMIPETVTNIEKNVFYNDVNLKEITIPFSVTNLGVRLFYNCTGLRNIYLKLTSSDTKITVKSDSWFINCNYQAIIHITDLESPTTVFGPFYNYYGTGEDDYLTVIADI